MDKNKNLNKGGIMNYRKFILVVMVMCLITSCSGFVEGDDTETYLTSDESNIEKDKKNEEYSATYEMVEIKLNEKSFSEIREILNDSSDMSYSDEISNDTQLLIEMKIEEAIKQEDYAEAINLFDSAIEFGVMKETDLDLDQYRNEDHPEVEITLFDNNERKKVRLTNSWEYHKSVIQINGDIHYKGEVELDIGNNEIEVWTVNEYNVPSEKVLLSYVFNKNDYLYNILASEKIELISSDYYKSDESPIYIDEYGGTGHSVVSGVVAVKDVDFDFKGYGIESEKITYTLFLDNPSRITVFIQEGEYPGIIDEPVQTNNLSLVCFTDFVDGEIVNEQIESLYISDTFEQSVYFQVLLREALDISRFSKLITLYPEIYKDRSKDEDGRVISDKRAHINTPLSNGGYSIRAIEYFFREDMTYITLNDIHYIDFESNGNLDFVLSIYRFHYESEPDENYIGYEVYSPQNKDQSNYLLHADFYSLLYQSRDIDGVTIGYEGDISMLEPECAGEVILQY